MLIPLLIASEIYFRLPATNYETSSCSTIITTEDSNIESKCALVVKTQKRDINLHFDDSRGYGISYILEGGGKTEIGTFNRKQTSWVVKAIWLRQDDGQLTLLLSGVCVATNTSLFCRGGGDGIRSMAWGDFSSLNK